MNYWLLFFCQICSSPQRFFSLLYPRMTQDEHFGFLQTFCLLSSTFLCGDLHKILLLLSFALVWSHTAGEMYLLVRFQPPLQRNDGEWNQNCTLSK